MSSAPRSFSRTGVAFLRQLERNNNKPWFEAHRAVYEAAVRAPMIRLVEAVSDSLATYDPDYLLPPHKLMLRIYRDTRFSADKRPYQHHVAAWWGHSLLERTSGAGFYFHFSAQGSMIAAGVFRPAREQLRAIRTTLLADHARAQELFLSLQQRGLGRGEQKDELLRMPKGFPADHPAAALVRQKSWGVERRLTVEQTLEPALADRVAEDFRSTHSLVRYFNAPLLAGRNACPPLF